MGHEAVRGYTAAHKRVRDTRGPARMHTCPCGVRAAQWAYDHNDPNPCTEIMPALRGGPVLVAWSDDPARYIAMCCPCHARLDLEKGNRANIAAGSRAHWAANRTRRTETFFNLAAALMAEPGARHYGYALRWSDGVKSGSLYAILRRMLGEGWLVDGWEDAAAARAEGRPPRRYYTVTEAGRTAMTELLRGTPQVTRTAGG